eukprot:1526959-Amphidinium_carterae.1
MYFAYPRFGAMIECAQSDQPKRILRRFEREKPLWMLWGKRGLIRSRASISATLPRAAGMSL